MEERLDKIKSGRAFSPPCKLHCKKCGEKSNVVAFDGPERKRYDGSTVVFSLSATCVRCGAVNDTIEVVAVFNGKANWGVYKKHVG